MLVLKLFLNCGLQRSCWGSSASSSLCFQQPVCSYFLQSSWVRSKWVLPQLWRKTHLRPLSEMEEEIVWCNQVLRWVLDIDPFSLSVNIQLRSGIKHVACALYSALSSSNEYIQLLHASNTNDLSSSWKSTYLKVHIPLRRTVSRACEWMQL